MTETELGTQLRERLLKKKLLPQPVLDQMSDAIIIESYCKCSNCGEVWIAGAELQRIILESKSATDFLDLTEAQIRPCK